MVRPEKMQARQLQEILVKAKAAAAAAMKYRISSLGFFWVVTNKSHRIMSRFRYITRSFL